MSVIRDSFLVSKISLNEWDVFVAAIPYQFYAILAISIVPMLAMLNFDFGAMRTSEIKIKRNSQNSSNLEIKDISAMLVWVPLVILGITLFVVLSFHGFPVKQVAGSDFRAALSFLDTPSPFLYMRPRLYCADISPRAAAKTYQCSAVLW